MRWATHAAIHIDRAACAWLVRRHIDARVRARARASSSGVTVGTPQYARRMAVFVLTRVNGPNYDDSRERRDQDAWTEHAAFMDRLLEDGFVIMGGPLDDGRQVLHIVQAADEREVAERLAGDPWEPMGILRTARIQRWDVWLDSRAAPGSS